MKKVTLASGLIILLSILPSGTASPVDGITANEAPHLSCSASGLGVYQTLTGSTRYTMVGGMNYSALPSATFWNLDWRSGANVTEGDLIAISGDGIITAFETGMSPVLDRHVNLSATAWYAQITFTTPPTLTSVRTRCGNQNNNDMLSSFEPCNAATIPEMEGYIATLVRAPSTPQGYVFEETDGTGCTVDSVPSPPRNLTLSYPRIHRLQIDWDYPEDNGTSPLLQYNIYRKDSITDTPILLTSVTPDIETYTDLLGCVQIAYNYTVTAVNSVGESDPANWTGFFYPDCRTNTLFGDDGILYGEGGSETLGASLGVSGNAIEYLFGFLLLMVLTGLGFMITSPFGIGAVGAAVGAVVGLILSAAWGMFGLWFILFFIAATLAGLALFLRGSN